MKAHKYSVVCHDQLNLINGTIENITELGCELWSAVNTTDPVFPQKTWVLLNILDESSGKSVNIKARLTRAERNNGRWIYRVRWPQVPEILADQVA